MPPRISATTPDGALTTASASRRDDGRPRRVRLGVVGLGQIGRVHAENLRGRVAGAELVAVVDDSEAVARSLGERLDAPWSRAYEALLDDDRVEAVVVATPTALHAAMVEQAAAAGKHVFCEKPLSLEEGTTQRVMDAAQEAGIKLQVGFHRRFDPDWVVAAQRIERGELGDVMLFRSSLRDMDPPPSGYVTASGGFFLDAMIHDFDAARWMIGDVRELSAFGEMRSPAFAQLADLDNAVVVLRFVNGAIGVLDGCRLGGYGYDCVAEVLGERGALRVDNPPRSNVRWLTRGATESTPWARSYVERFEAAYRLQMEHFVRAILDDGTPAVSGADALAALRLALAARRSLETGSPVAVEAP